MWIALEKLCCAHYGSRGIITFRRLVIAPPGFRANRGCPQSDLALPDHAPLIDQLQRALAFQHDNPVGMHVVSASAPGPVRPANKPPEQ